MTVKLYMLDVPSGPTGGYNTSSPYTWVKSTTVASVFRVVTKATMTNTPSTAFMMFLSVCTDFSYKLKKTNVTYVKAHRKSYLFYLFIYLFIRENIDNNIYLFIKEKFDIDILALFICLFLFETYIVPLYFTKLMSKTKHFDSFLQ